MVSWTTIIPLYSLSLLASSRKLTTEENEWNSEKCGVHFLGANTTEKHLTKRSVGGRKFERNEYPWTVIVETESAFCSGVQISPIHILTAAHCFVHPLNKKDCESKGFDSVASVMRGPEDILVHIRDNKSNNSHSIHCIDPKKAYKATNIIVHNFEPCDNQRDIALVELGVNISEHFSTPICMPKEDLSLAEILFATGTGIDSTIPATRDSSSNNCLVQRVVAQRYFNVNETRHEIVTVAFARSTCKGDSGGPVFQVDEDGRHILVGLTSTGSTCTKHTNKNMLSNNVDVRAYLDWICKYSGVCPIEERKD